MPQETIPSKEEIIENIMFEIELNDLYTWDDSILIDKLKLREILEDKLKEFITNQQKWA